MYEHNALGYRSGLALCLTKVRSSRARCPATALILLIYSEMAGPHNMTEKMIFCHNQTKPTKDFKNKNNCSVYILSYSFDDSVRFIMKWA